MTTYADYEKSVDNGLPVELYEIAYSGKVWRFTTNIENVIIGDSEYVAVAIQRGETEDTADATKASMEISIARNSLIGNIFKVTPPSEPVTITIKQYHAFLGYSNPDLQTITVWKGRVTNVTWREQYMVLNAESVFSSLLRIGVTRKYSRQCTHVLYGKGCRLNRDDFAMRIVPSSIVGTVLAVAHNQPYQWFNGGYIRYLNAETNAPEYRSIVESTGSTITLNAIPMGLVAGQTEIVMYAGCNHTLQACREKFNNVENYGGQPFIPIQNPFGNSSIY